MGVFRSVDVSHSAGIQDLKNALNNYWVKRSSVKEILSVGTMGEQVLSVLCDSGLVISSGKWVEVHQHTPVN